MSSYQKCRDRKYLTQGNNMSNNDIIHSGIRVKYYEVWMYLQVDEKKKADTFQTLCLEVTL